VRCSCPGSATKTTLDEVAVAANINELLLGGEHRRLPLKKKGDVKNPKQLLIYTRTVAHDIALINTITESKGNSLV
jgi:hypothetical protein